MLNYDETTAHHAPLISNPPTTADGVVAALRAVSGVVLLLSMLAVTALTVLSLAAGEFAAAAFSIVGVAIAAGVVLVIALPIALPLGALLARLNAVPAAMLLAPVAGFLTPLALFRDVGFAGACGAISILVGVIYMTDARFLRPR